MLLANGVRHLAQQGGFILGLDRRVLPAGAQTCPFDRLRVPSEVEGLRPLQRARQDRAPTTEECVSAQPRMNPPCLAHNSALHFGCGIRPRCETYRLPKASLDPVDDSTRFYGFS